VSNYESETEGYTELFCFLVTDGVKHGSCQIKLFLNSDIHLRRRIIHWRMVSGNNSRSVYNLSSWLMSAVEQNPDQAGLAYSNLVSIPYIGRLRTDSPGTLQELA